MGIQGLIIKCIFVDTMSTGSDSSDSARGTKPPSPIISPGAKFDDALLALSNKDTQWEALISALGDIKDIAAEFPTLFSSNSTNATSLVIRHCNS